MGRCALRKIWPLASGSSFSRICLLRYSCIASSCMRRRGYTWSILGKNDYMNVKNNKVAVFRKEHFNAAHRIFNPAWDDKKNAEVFGKCSNPNYHGHNYELIVKVVGTPDPDTGYVMDMKKLSVIVKEEVLERFDHKNLNLDTEQ